MAVAARVKRTDLAVPARVKRTNPAVPKVNRKTMKGRQVALRKVAPKTSQVAAVLRISHLRRTRVKMMRRKTMIRKQLLRRIRGKLKVKVEMCG